jgi:hypothetical protein
MEVGPAPHREDKEMMKEFSLTGYISYWHGDTIYRTYPRGNVSIAFRNNGVRDEGTIQTNEDIILKVRVKARQDRAYGMKAANKDVFRGKIWFVVEPDVEMGRESVCHGVFYELKREAEEAKAPHLELAYAYVEIKRISANVLTV